MPDNNLLIHETSPYLLQHATNPVAWHAWNKQALDIARQENKPVLLSIGYSACHWCHVMAHESFENQETAALMNELFINIKVDREERPDLDKIYQLAHQFLNQRGGGWPLTIFLTPGSLIPFFSGTYFPSQPRYGMPAFTDILQRIAEYFRENQDEIKIQNNRLMDAFENLHSPAHDTVTEFNTAPLDAARYQLEHSFESQFGGFGHAPKFPHPPHIERLLRHWAASAIGARPDKKALEMASFSLEKMAMGGIYDQLGGGFYRYSVDEKWMIPHFEKMLYDNAQLLPLYSECSAATAIPLFRQIACETAEWVMRDMQGENGGYYSSLDADSEGREGKFYSWDAEQIKTLLSADEFRVASQHFGLDQTANFEGKWHLHIRADSTTIAKKCDMPEAQVIQHINTARSKLLNARVQRVRPDRDDKILTAWNSLMIKGMAIASRHQGRDDFLRSAHQSLDFIRDNLWQAERLLATSKDGKSHLPAYLDDYVFLIDAILELLQTQWRTTDMEFAIALADSVLRHFGDPQHGGFFFTADDHEELIYRPKPLGDDALPAGNGIAAKVLWRLGHILGKSRYLDAAEQTLRAAWPGISDLPYAHNTLLLALEEYLNPPQIIILRGETARLHKWHQRAVTPYAPRRITLAIPDSAGELPGLLAMRRPGNDVIAYICTGTSCREPQTDYGDFSALLEQNEVSTEQSQPV